MYLPYGTGCNEASVERLNQACNGFDIMQRSNDE